MKLFDNVLPAGYFNTIEQTIMGPAFPWNINTNTVNLGSTLGYWDDHTEDSQQFTHVFAHDGQVVSDYYPLIQPMLYFLELHTGKEWNVLRVKANMLIREPGYPEGKYNTQHMDVFKPLGAPSRARSFLFYLNDSDGVTQFFDSDHQQTHHMVPKANSGMLFDSTTWHASTPPRTGPNRVVLNFILEPRLG